MTVLPTLNPGTTVKATSGERSGDTYATSFTLSMNTSENRLPFGTWNTVAPSGLNEKAKQCNSQTHFATSKNESKKNSANTEVGFHVMYSLAFKDFNSINLSKKNSRVFSDCESPGIANSRRLKPSNICLQTNDSNA
ncbi:hypothetical protein HanIR_Chr03g0125381 [Helianthus annuus]|nr:hypothetical protein HanIR_Chr03g0125381 [Helianthus annuus]